MISPELLLAYRETSYVVASDEAGGAEGRFTLNIGIASLPLMSLYKRHGVDCAAFITAFNPRSQRETSLRNHAMQAQLRAWTERHGYFHLKGVGQHPAGTWPGEPSLLILALPRAQARNLGRVYGQNAVVWCDHDAVPQLVFVDDD
ncbi:MAG TPA: DUF3293 domain-containing protein [Nevskiaceae bacterium]|nr:DUF3293 domain-containing protein [Nevskiaceae bacterium]